MNTEAATLYEYNCLLLLFHLLTLYRLLVTSYSLLLTFYQLPSTTYHLPTFPICNSLQRKELSRKNLTKSYVNFGWPWLHAAGWFFQSSTYPTAGPSFNARVRSNPSNDRPNLSFVACSHRTQAAKNGTLAIRGLSQRNTARYVPLAGFLSFLTRLFISNTEIGVTQ